jgi:hypothetical protein
VADEASAGGAAPQKKIEKKQKKGVLKNYTFLSRQLYI